MYYATDIEAHMNLNENRRSINVTNNMLIIIINIIIIAIIIFFIIRH